MTTLLKDEEDMLMTTVRSATETVSFVDAYCATYRDLLGVGRNGLMHISEMTAKRITRVEEAVKVGDKVQVKVIEIDPNSKRISLTMPVDEALPNDRERPVSRVAAASARAAVVPVAKAVVLVVVLVAAIAMLGGSTVWAVAAMRAAADGRVRSTSRARIVYTFEDPEEEVFTGDATLEDLVSKFNEGKDSNRRDDDEEEVEEGGNRGRPDAIRRSSRCAMRIRLLDYYYSLLYHLS